MTESIQYCSVPLKIEVFLTSDIRDVVAPCEGTFRRKKALLIKREKGLQGALRLFGLKSEALVFEA